MPLDRTKFGGLRTDGPPDQLGDNAYDLQNVIPSSPTNVDTRNGVSLAETYLSASSGRPIFIDGEPGNEGDGALVVAADNADHGDGTVDTTVQWLTDYRPSALPTDLQTAHGFTAEAVLSGIAF